MFNVTKFKYNSTSLSIQSLMSAKKGTVKMYVGSDFGELRLPVVSVAERFKAPVSSVDSFVCKRDF